MASIPMVDVIFLDIDGVLLPFGDKSKNSEEKSCSGVFPDRTLWALSKILASTKAEIVLSSTWRAREQFMVDILQAFRDYGEVFGGPLSDIKEFYGVTALEMHSERQWEIHEWLFGHRDSVRAWVALDDEELIQGEKNAPNRKQFEGHVVKTVSHIGLTEQNADAAVALLKWQNS